MERAGNRLPDPATVFILLGLLAIALSAVAQAFSLQVQHPLSQEPIHAVSLLNSEGIRRILTEAVSNFMGFAPLGVVLTAMLGIGIAERTGLFGAALRWLVLAVPRGAITPTVVLAGISSNVASDAGYVVLPPLAALLFVSLGRHPLAGIAAAFAGIGGGFSANLFISTLDPKLASISTEAAQLIDPDYEVNTLASYFFMAASVVLLTVVATWVTHRLVEPRLGPWKNDAPAPETLPELTPLERRGLAAAAASFFIGLLVTAVLAGPAGAPLRLSGPTGLLDQLKPFFDSVVVLMALLFVLPGLAYGICTRKIRNDRDAVGMLSETMATMGSYIVMAFFASQFLAYFGWSNLGLILAVGGADLLRAVHLTGVPLMILFVFLAALVNLFMASASAKWALMAPVFIPMFMMLGWSPESTQGLYRVGDSLTNTITPLNYYFPMIIAVMRRYLPGAGLGTIVAAMLPYSLAFTLFWTAFAVLWLSLGIPLGPGAPLQYTAP